MKNEYPKNIIVMKVGPHSGLSLSEIINSKIEEEKIHGVHYWGYSGVFCHPKRVQKFCRDKKDVKLILIETKSNYDSQIGFIKEYSIDNNKYEKFTAPVQLQGAQYSFIAKNIKKIDKFSLDNYLVAGGKNVGKPLLSHLKFRINKSFATLNNINKAEKHIKVIVADLVYPYAVWLR